MGTVSLDLPLEQAVPATLVELAFAPGVEFAWVNSDVDLYMVVGGYGAGGAVPAGNRYRIPLGICHPVRRPGHGSKLWFAAVTTVGTMWAYAHPGRPTAPGVVAEDCR